MVEVVVVRFSDVDVVAVVVVALSVVVVVVVFLVVLVISQGGGRNVVVDDVVVPARLVSPNAGSMGERSPSDCVPFNLSSSDNLPPPGELDPPPPWSSPSWSS